MSSTWRNRLYEEKTEKIDFSKLKNDKFVEDQLFVNVIQNGTLGVFVFITFLLGLMSAAYSSADIWRKQK